MSVAKMCSTCHWWTEAMGDNGVFNACVFLNGIKSSLRSRVRCKGILLTHPDFGCVEWRTDEREKKEASHA